MLQTVLSVVIKVQHSIVEYNKEKDESEKITYPLVLTWLLVLFRYDETC